MIRRFARFRQFALLAGFAIAVPAFWHLRGGFAAESDPTAGFEETVAEPGVLVMRNGEVVEGRILKTGDSYMVQRPNGNAVFPGYLVSMRCATIRDAYAKLHENARRRGEPRAHGELARWCVTNKLIQEARTELTDALELDPGNEEARKMLVRVNDMLSPKGAEGAKKLEDPNASAPRAARFAEEEVESLGSLTREQAQYFTRRIQPILVNNCAVAGCHGADSKTGFRLQRVTAGGDTSRINSERNLAVVLEQINFKSPKSSPLLTVPRSTHGRRGKSPFTGPRGTEQLADLKQWVQAIAKSEAVRERRNNVASRPAERIELVAGVESEKREIVVGSTSSGKEPAEFPRRASEPVSGESTAKTGPPPAPRSDERPTDPFDPTAFNQNAPAVGSRR